MTYNREYDEEDREAGGLLLRETFPKARKDHTCGTCHRGIPKGTTYAVHVFIAEGDFGTYRTCLDCFHGDYGDYGDPYQYPEEDQTTQAATVTPTDTVPPTESQQ